MDASIIYNLISTGQLDEIFSKLYIDPSTFGYQRTRYADAIEKFEKLFGTCDISIFSAPGRTEIGGNHTDHQHGQVLAAAINNDAIAVASKCEGAVHLFSKGYGQIDVDMSSLVPVEEEPAAVTTFGVFHSSFQPGPDFPPQKYGTLPTSASPVVRSCFLA